MCARKNLQTCPCQFFKYVCCLKQENRNLKMVLGICSRAIHRFVEAQEQICQVLQEFLRPFAFTIFRIPLDGELYWKCSMFTSKVLNFIYKHIFWRGTGKSVAVGFLTFILSSKFFGTFSKQSLLIVYKRFHEITQTILQESVQFFTWKQACAQVVAKAFARAILRP